MLQRNMKREVAPAEVTRNARSSFAYAFLFLPREQRDALDAVYAFCRLVDDAADEAPSPEAARTELRAWRRRLDAVYAHMPGPLDAEPERALVLSLRSAVRMFPLAQADFEAVIEGCEWDASRTRYATWDDLREYCLRVASAVGLLCIGIFGYTNIRTRDYATDLGLALQLTNIVRDVAEDAARGRIYLPLEDLLAFGVTEDDILCGRPTPNLQRLLGFEARRARLHFARARAAISDRERAHLVVAEIMGDIYEALLHRLEAERFPAQKISLSSTKKAALALRRFALSRLA